MFVSTRKTIINQPTRVLIKSGSLHYFVLSILCFVLTSCYSDQNELEAYLIRDEQIELSNIELTLFSEDCDKNTSRPSCENSYKGVFNENLFKLNQIIDFTINTSGLLVEMDPEQMGIKSPDRVAPNPRISIDEIALVGSECVTETANGARGPLSFCQVALICQSKYQVLMQFTMYGADYRVVSNIIQDLVKLHENICVPHRNMS